MFPLRHETVQWRLAAAPAALLVAALLAGSPRSGDAQGIGTSPTGPSFVDAGSERERYLRMLQTGGDIPLFPWSIRPFGPAESARLLDSVRANPWGFTPLDSNALAARSGFHLLPATARLYFNSAFPYGAGDGAVWQGRGVTAAVEAGVEWSAGPFSIKLQPIAFAAQNASFSLKENGKTGEGVYANGFWPDNLDEPQRFGDDPYIVLHPGQSTARVDLGPFTAGISSANHYWGPAQESPILLGDNASGFVHGFAGTSRPVNVYVGHLHSRIVWGQKHSSDYFEQERPGTNAYVTGLIATFSPRGVPGLELGGARIFHMPWPSGGVSSLKFFKSFEGILKRQLGSRPDRDFGDEPDDNQIASVFFRWAFPAARFEVHGEYGREDHNMDLRDLIGEPDHDAAYSLGIQRVWGTGDRRHVLRGEVFNSRISHLSQSLSQAPWYIHGGPVNLSHTHDGQVLGAPGGFGGGAALLAFDRYDESGRWSIQWSRRMRAERTEGQVLPQGDPDVIHALGAERLLRRGRLELGGSATAMMNFNRDFQGDRFNLNLGLITRVALP